MQVTWLSILHIDNLQPTTLMQQIHILRFSHSYIFPSCAAFKETLIYGVFNIEIN